MLKTDFENSLYPWINTLPGEYETHTLSSFLICKKALDDLMSLKISWASYLEILSAQGMDMDDYLETSFYNFVACDFLVNQ